MSKIDMKPAPLRSPTSDLGNSTLSRKVDLTVSLRERTAIIERKILIGKKRESVRFSWGEPRRKSQSVGRGWVRDHWVYGSSSHRDLQHTLCGTVSWTSWSDGKAAACDDERVENQ